MMDYIYLVAGYEDEFPVDMSIILLISELSVNLYFIIYQRALCLSATIKLNSMLGKIGDELV